MSKKKRTYITLFSSAGVGCYGFKLNGFDCVATNELLDVRLDIQKPIINVSMSLAILEGTLRPRKHIQDFLMRLKCGKKKRV